MTALDIFVILLLGGATLIGFVRGFTHEVLSLVAWIVGIAALKLFHTPLQERLIDAVGTSAGASVVAFAGPRPSHRVKVTFDPALPPLGWMTSRVRPWVDRKRTPPSSGGARRSRVSLASRPRSASRSANTIQPRLQSGLPVQRLRRNWGRSPPR